MYCKTYETQNGTVLAACDEEIIGKNLVEGQYDVTIETTFYKGEIVKEEELAQMLSGAASINLFGKKTVSVALKQGFLTEKDIIRIAGVEHAVITVEDHWSEGGLGDAVLNLFNTEPKVNVHKLAVTKMPKSGKPEELLAYEQIDAGAIVAKVKEILEDR